MVLFSAEPRVYTNDVDYHFRQENNLFYLTHLNQKRSVLVLMPGTATPEILFLPRRNALRETWDGYMYSPQQANELSGVKEIWEASEFAPFIAALSKRESLSPETRKRFALVHPISDDKRRRNGVVVRGRAEE